MEFIDLLKVGANKKEAAIAASKITTPTIDMGGVEIQSVIALLMSPLMSMEDGGDTPPFDPTFGGEDRRGLLQKESHLVVGHIADIQIDNIEFVFVNLRIFFHIKVLVDDQDIALVSVAYDFVDRVFHVFYSLSINNVSLRVVSGCATCRAS